MSHKKIQTADFFSKEANRWKVVYEDKNKSDFRSAEMRTRKKIISKIINDKSAQNSLKVLDVGCGTGALSFDCLALGHQVFATDLSFDMLRFAQKESKTKWHRKFFLSLGDIENLPFASDTFDIIICAGVIQYLDKDEKAIRELARVLKKGGTSIITIPNLITLRNLADPYIIYKRLPALISKVMRNNNHSNKKEIETCYDFKNNSDFSNRRYYYSQLDKLFKHHNLVIKKIHPIGFGPICFFEKNIFTSEFATRLNVLLTKATSRKPFNYLISIANRWVYCLEKKYA